MSGNTLKFNLIKLNKKEFHKSKQPIDLSLVTVDQIVISDKFKHSDDGFKYFIGYQEGEIVRPLCIDVPKENMHCTCIACITIDSGMRMDKKKSSTGLFRRV